MFVTSIISQFRLYVAQFGNFLSYEAVQSQVVGKIKYCGRVHAKN